MITGELKSALNEIKQEAAQMPSIKPVADLMGSIQITADGASASLTGEIPPGMLGAMMGQIPLLELLGESARDVAGPMPTREVQPLDNLP